MSFRISGLRLAASALAVTSALPAIAAAQPHLEEVRVVGTPHDASPSELAQSVTVLRGDTLTRTQAATLGETLAAELGVTSTAFGRGASRPIIRGLAGARVKIMEDGVDALDASSLSADHAIGVEPFAATQIEVFRGPTTLLYGSGAVGGVVNTVTRRLPQRVPRALEGGVELRADSVADERSIAMQWDGGHGAWAWHVDGALRSANDYEAPGPHAASDGLSPPPHAEFDAPAPPHDDGDDAPVPTHADGEASAPTRRVANTGYDGESLAAGVGFVGQRTNFAVSLSRFATVYGLPAGTHAHPAGHGEHFHEHDHGHDDVSDHDHGGDHGPDPGHDPGHDHDDAHSHAPGAHAGHHAPVRIDLEQTRLDVRAEWFGFDRFESVTVRVGANDYRHLELEGDATATVFENDAYEGRVEVAHRPWGAWSGAFGLQIGERRFAASGEEAYVPPVDTRSAGVFLLEERASGPYRFSLGGRAEQVSHRSSTGARHDASATSLSAAMTRRLPKDHVMVLNAASAERVPAAEELYADGPHLASNAYELGNPGLDVETARHLDVGVRRTDGRLRWAVTAFRTHYDDFIYLSEAGTTDEGTGLPVFAYVQRDARFEGVELELFARVIDVGRGEIDARLYADTVSGRLEDGGWLPRIPPRRRGLRLQYHDDRWLAGVEAVRYDAQTRTAPYETATGAYTDLRFDVLVKLRTQGPVPLELFASGSNLLDERARRHSSIVKGLAPLPGRNFTLGLRASF